MSTTSIVVLTSIICFSVVLCVIRICETFEKVAMINNADTIKDFTEEE